MGVVLHGAVATPWVAAVPAPPCGRGGAKTKRSVLVFSMCTVGALKKEPFWDGEGLRVPQVCFTACLRSSFCFRWGAEV
eukprot:212509-Pyramimonas_sp.AAC.1